MFFSILYFLFCSIFAGFLIQWRFLDGGAAPSGNVYINISRKYTKGGKTAAFRRECDQTCTDMQTHSSVFVGGLMAQRSV